MMVVHWASKLVDLMSNAVLLSLLSFTPRVTDASTKKCQMSLFFFFAGSEPSGCALRKDFDVTYF